MTQQILAALAGIEPAQIAMLIAGGLITGLLAGLFGIGGGAILVPVLHDVFGTLGVPAALKMHMAVGTSLAIIVPTTFKSFRAHQANGAVEMAVLRRLAPPVVLGVIAGVIIARSASGTALKWVWIVFLCCMAAKMLFGRDDWRLGPDIPKSRAVEAYGVFVGIVSTLLSIGGGAFMTAFLTLYGRTIKQAISTSSGLGPVIAIPGMLGFMWAGWPYAAAGQLPVGSIGYVNVVAALLIMPLSIFTAPFGARLSQAFSRRTLEIAFGCFALTMAARFIYSLFQ